MAISLKAEDPCGCGNGRTYGECHQPIYEAPEGQVLNVAHRVYAQEWAGNADAYEGQGLYSALASELTSRGSIQRVLDVGCGLGHGLQAIRESLSGGSVELIGADENPDCLAIAAERLGAELIEANVDRMQDIVLPGGHYCSTPKAGPITTTGALTLVQADLLVRDDPFNTWLDNFGPLDAVTLWFSGVHKARAATEIAAHFDIRSDSDHRECVEDAVFQLARRRLRPGGVLQVVNRGAFASERLALSEYWRLYEPLAETAGLKLLSVTPTRYNEPTGSDAIRVRNREHDVSGLPNYATSMIFRQPC
jgi:SAM-dependent methyltransferase